MRKLFWLFLVSFLVSGTSAFATPNDGGIIITLEKEVMLDEELPQARSLFEPAYAFLEDNMVHVLFQKIIYLRLPSELFKNLPDKLFIQTTILVRQPFP